MVNHDPKFASTDILSYNFLDMRTMVGSRSVAYAWALGDGQEEVSGTGGPDDYEANTKTTKTNTGVYGGDRLYHETLAPLALRKVREAKAGNYLVRQMFDAQDRGELSVDTDIVTPDDDWLVSSQERLAARRY